MNIGAVVIWLGSSSVGLLFANNVWFTGPAAAALGGIDIGFLVAAAIPALVYWVGPARHLRAQTKILKA